MLIIFSGLSATGKSTIAAKVAQELAAVYLRMDSLEMGIVRAKTVADQWDLGPAGYFAAYAIALDNLRNTMPVVADSVNPLQITREGWQEVARQAGKPSLDIEVICSDEAEHRRRVETRQSDIEGMQLPTWEQIREREYEPWSTERLILDTARLSVEEAVARVVARVVEEAGDLLSGPANKLW